MRYEEFAIIFHIVGNEYRAIEFKKQTVHIFSARHTWDPMDHVKKDCQATFFWKTRMEKDSAQEMESRVVPVK